VERANGISIWMVGDAESNARDAIEVGRDRVVWEIAAIGAEGRTEVAAEDPEVMSLVRRLQEITEREGLPVTSPLRTIPDAAVAGVSPDRGERAILDVLTRGWVETEQLLAGARELRPDVARVIS